MRVGKLFVFRMEDDPLAVTRFLSTTPASVFLSFEREEMFYIGRKKVQEIF